ncbi:hypothetical protein B0H10DRAFT_2191533 [Mycena sp. CBHHK59/15]|nr:hypothetical protein B0H10DRAFT_2191533 [Mycena sp. CBHHK59/15]
MDLPERSPPADRCCGLCNPFQLAWFRPSSARYHHLRHFAADFVNPIAEPEQKDPDPRPTSPSSAISDESTDTIDFEPFEKGQSVSKAEKDTLRARLVEWRLLRHKKRGSNKFLSSEVALPPRTLEALVSSSGKFLSEAVIGKKKILAIVKHWDFGTDEDFRDVAEIVSDWRTIFVSVTPKSQHRTHKRTRAGSVSIPAPPQPTFTPTRQPMAPQNCTQSSPNTNTLRLHINSINIPRTPNSTRHSMADDVFSSPATPASRFDSTPWGPAPNSQSISRSRPRASGQYPPSLARPVRPPVNYTTPFPPLGPLLMPQAIPHAVSEYYRPYVSNQTPHATLYQRQYPATPISTPNLIPSRPNYTQMWPTNT